MPSTFPKNKRLKNSSEFQKIAKEGSQKVGRFFILCNRPSLTLPRLGITVSRRYGKANVRNRFKRIVREAFRLSYLELPLQEFNIIPRKEAKKATMDDIRQELLALTSDFRKHL